MGQEGRYNSVFLWGNQDEGYHKFQPDLLLPADHFLRDCFSGHFAVPWTGNGYPIFPVQTGFTRDLIRGFTTSHLRRTGGSGRVAGTPLYEIAGYLEAGE